MSKQAAKKRTTKTQAKSKPVAKAVSKKAKNTVEKDESKIVLEIHRHWFGLFSLYALLGFGILLVLVFILIIDDFWRDNAGVTIISAFFILITLVVLFFSIGYVYRGNIIMISKTNVRQLTRQAIFFNKFSILGLANVEDVTVIREGFFSHFLNYGVLNIETAGEQENFTFRYCPRPEECTRILMETREQYLSEVNYDQQTLS